MRLRSIERYLEKMPYVDQLFHQNRTRIATLPEQGLLQSKNYFKFMTVPSLVGDFKPRVGIAWTDRFYEFAGHKFSVIQTDPRHNEFSPFNFIVHIEYFEGYKINIFASFLSTDMIDRESFKYLDTPRIVNPDIEKMDITQLKKLIKVLRYERSSI